MLTKRRNPRKYTGVLQYFHNFEHDPLGRNHCKGGKSNPYTIEHVNSRHKINLPYARGHGRGGRPQWFQFTRRLSNGYDMSSGQKIDFIPTARQRSGK